MRSHANVVVVGGGVVGCSILYHLAKLGQKDCVLLERQELTSGSSWHAAGGLFTVTAPSPVAEVHKYTFDCYRELERESGQSCGFHDTGGLGLCRTREEAEMYTRMGAAVRRQGIESHMISLDEVRRRAPIIDTTPLYAALWEDKGGHVDPASATQAFAAAARKLGAVIHRHTPVIETNALPDGRWQVVTPSGTIIADVLVNAAGLWGREVAALAGIRLPLVPVEHHYLVTETVPEVAALDFELPQINDGETNCYARQEGQGLLLGAYETPCRHWAEAGTPMEFGHELLPDDISRMDWHFEQAAEIMPCLARAGVKRIINGPMIFSPDLGPLLGPYPKLTNYYCANGVMTGFNQGGGIGRLMAEWIIEGEPSFDISCWDVARFGDWATPEYTRATTGYFYEHRSDRVYPEQDHEAGRPLRKPLVYDRLKAANAVFGASFGLEYPAWYAPAGTEPRDQPGYARPNWFNPVNEECRRVRETAGLFEYSAMGKFTVEGPDAATWLDTLLANRLPQRDGRMMLSPMLNKAGRVRGDVSVSRLSEDRFVLFGSDVMQLAFERIFGTHQPDLDVKVSNQSANWSGLHLAGPAAQGLLAELAEADVSTHDFPFMSAGRFTIAGVRDVLVLRVSFTGETGYELYCANEQQPVLFDRIMQAGGANGLALAGTRSLMRLRLEKSFPAWGLDLSPDYTAYEAGLGNFVDCDKPAFIGRDACIDMRGQQGRETLVTFEIDADKADAWGDEPVWLAGETVGYITSGGYGACTRKSLAMGYVRADCVDPAASYTVEILGQQRPAILQTRPVFDPDGSRMRA